MCFKDRVRYIFYTTHELKIIRIATINYFLCFINLSPVSASIRNLVFLKPKVVEVGLGEAEGELLPAM